MSAGLAYSPRFNHAVHEVDAAGLKLRDGRLLGELKVTVEPDPYKPKDGKPIPCTYTIDAAVQDGGLAGTFRGKWGADAVAGAVAGLYQAPPQIGDTYNLSLKMEVGVTGKGAPWHKRTYISVQVKDGKATGGKVSNNKGGFQATFDKADLRLREGKISGTIVATVTSGQVDTGTYTFTIDGSLVGDQIIGQFQSALGGRVVKSGPFMGGIALTP